MGSSGRVLIRGAEAGRQRVPLQAEGHGPCKIQLCFRHWLGVDSVTEKRKRKKEIWEEKAKFWLAQVNVEMTDAQ